MYTTLGWSQVRAFSLLYVKPYLITLCNRYTLFRRLKAALWRRFRVGLLPAIYQTIFCQLTGHGLTGLAPTPGSDVEFLAEDLARKWLRVIAHWESEGNVSLESGSSVLLTFWFKFVSALLTSAMWKAKMADFLVKVFGESEETWKWVFKRLPAYLKSWDFSLRSEILFFLQVVLSLGIPSSSAGGAEEGSYEHLFSKRMFSNGCNNTFFCNTQINFSFFKIRQIKVVYSNTKSTY